MTGNFEAAVKPGEHFAEPAKQESERDLFLSEFMESALRKRPQAKELPPEVFRAGVASPIDDEADWRWPKPTGIVKDRALELDLTKEEKERIGKKVWRNESGGTYEGLTAWNDGEEFPSLGIGHFIWMPKNVDLPFGQSFPEMMRFVEAQGKTLPSWLKPEEPCPWNTKKEFMRDFNKPKLTELRKFLADTVPEQTDFLIQRLEKALPRILDKVDPAMQAKVQERFYRVLNSGPAGVFCLVDYVNFKGEGLELVKEYNNVSWGLRQVLEGMKDGPEPVRDFADSAKDVLSNRVKNAPKHRNEERWLKGWHARIERYVTDPPLKIRTRKI